MTIDTKEAPSKQPTSTPPQYLLRRLLQHLAVLEWATPEELAQTMGIPSKQVHRLADCLERRQLLVFQKEQNTLIFVITKKGQEENHPIRGLIDLA